jgi:hypothetical protein
MLSLSFLVWLGAVNVPHGVDWEAEEFDKAVFTLSLFFSH